MIYDLFIVFFGRKIGVSAILTAHVSNSRSDVCEKPLKLVLWSTKTVRYLNSFWLLLVLS